MSSAELELIEEDFVFERSEDQRRRGRWMLIAGLGAGVLSLVGLGFSLVSRVDQLTLHSISTFPMIVAVSLLSAGWSMCRGPECVVIDEEGFQIQENGKTTSYLWKETGWVTVDGTSMSQQKCLVLFDTSGKRIASLSEAFEDFEDLVRIVKSKVADQPGSPGGEIQSRKARKSATWIGIFAIVLIGVSGSVAWMTWEEQRANRLLRSNSIPGEASIDRLFVAPNGVTTRVEYTVTTESGETGSRNAEVEPSYYAQLEREDAQTIPVRYVPSEPSISRLRTGEVRDEDFVKTPLGGYGLAGLTTLMGLGFLAAAVLQWMGWDIDMDSKTGKLSIKRFGEGD